MILSREAVLYDPHDRSTGNHDSGKVTRLIACLRLVIIRFGQDEYEIAEEARKLLLTDGAIHVHNGVVQRLYCILLYTTYAMQSHIYVLFSHLTSSSRLQLVQESLRFEEKHNLMHSSPDATRAQIDSKSRLAILGRLIRIINTSETLNFTLACLGVDTSTISLLAVLEWRGDVDEVERAELLDHLFGLLAGRVERRDRACDDGCAGFGQF